MRNYLSRILQITVVAFLMVGNAYAQKGGTKLSFSSSVQYGSQSNNLTVLASSDFNGDYSLESVKAAKWTDITKKFSLATDKVLESSGNKDISDVLVAGKPLYIAFKYTGEASAKPSQRGWGVAEVTLNHKGETKTLPIKDFTIVNNSENHEGATWVKGADVMRFRSNQSLQKSESWAIAKIIE